MNLSLARHGSAPRVRHWWRHRRVVVAVESTTAVAALVGGALLVAAPDGSLLRADPAALTASPFDNWRVPGLLLATLVGGGYAVIALATVRRWRPVQGLTLAAGGGLMLFEAAGMLWIGSQPLEAVFALVGAYVFAAAAAPPIPGPA